MSLLNNTATYAIRAALHVAAEGPAPGEFVSTRRIAEELGVPFAFLTKVLQGLTQCGILLSQRGAAGGVALARPASAITLLDILAGMGSDSVFRECVLGLPTCSDETPCALHGPWRVERTKVEEIFSNTTLADLASGSGGAGLRDLASDRTDAVKTKGRRPKQRRAT
jgi:Rrf2 family transcriptional regulator, iron-sulfur cluster assembly transcription factor